MKRTLKVIFNFQPMRNYYPHCSKWEHIKWKLGRTVRNFSIVASFALTGYVSAVSYNTLHPVTVWATRDVVKEVETVAPVMDRIAQCESGKSHFAKNGQVLVHVNSNGTYDAGYLQINSVWNAQAAKLGYNLMKEEDNKAFGLYLYKNFGTVPWESSRKVCWNK